MRLIKQSIEKDGSGTITLFPEEPEDMVSSHDLPSVPKLTSNSGTPTTSSPQQTSSVHLPSAA
jgi:protein pelota